ncbi:hypothetical protein [Elongatibacter sediminis]|uniref:Uncharacterized protein n=1 Tax=Elongatibacter sediminis TaxID=3119006 RepID=A0AAW9REP1_9GAMM
MKILLTSKVARSGGATTSKGVVFWLPEPVVWQSMPSKSSALIAYVPG